MKVKSLVLIISFILLCLLNLTQVFATSVQIPDSNNDTSHIDVIDVNTRIFFAQHRCKR